MGKDWPWPKTENTYFSLSTNHQYLQLRWYQNLIKKWKSGCWVRLRQDFEKEDQRDIDYQISKFNWRSDPCLFYNGQQWIDTQDWKQRKLSNTWPKIDQNYNIPNFASEKRILQIPICSQLFRWNWGKRKSLLEYLMCNLTI